MDNKENCILIESNYKSDLKKNCRASKNVLEDSFFQEKYTINQKIFNKSILNTSLPNTKLITVVNPPIKNGFGMLKVGEQIIYKGMWR
jgi:hypothetical protein